MHPERTTVWCGFWVGGVIGPFFFEVDEGDTVTINGERYRHMLTSFLWPFLQNIDMQNLWFQQDGATCHNSRETINIIKEKFPGRLISLRGDQERPARSCDLTPSDFFMWSYAKSKVYANNRRTIQQLKAKILRIIADITPDICERVIINFIERVNTCRLSGGGHMPDIVFHH
jgi:hypothetical protein